MLPDWLFPGKIPEVIGPFRILRLLGEGGMGAVFLAERIEPSTQRVAIKIFQPSLFPEPAVAPDVQEETNASALNHPGIVRLLDIGETTQGLRYLVMEFVDGEPLDQYCDNRGLSIRNRIEILVEVLKIVEYAHSSLVIHADLKPSSILVTAEGKPSLLDFGIATILFGRPADPPTGFPRHFASPEQLAGERPAVATDIYSLGAIAHSILTGLLPHTVSSESSRAAPAGGSTALSMAELASTDTVLLNSIAECRGEAPLRFLALIHGDLEAILNKALSIDPSERFESVQQMAEELRRHLDGYPLRIRPAGWEAHLRKWIHRNQATTALTLGLAVVVTLSVLGVASQTAEAARKRQEATNRLHEVAKLTDRLAGELYSSVPGLPGSEAAHAALLQNAHQTMEMLSAEVTHDPQIDIEIAEEYEKLARIELSLTSNSAEARRQALDDLDRAVRLLSLLPQNEPRFAHARQRLPEMIALHDSLAPAAGH